MLLSIMIGAQILAYSFVSTGLNHQITDWIVGLIPSPIDQNPCAHWRNPMDMMRQG
jgi:hypothetical protein